MPFRYIPLLLLILIFPISAASKQQIGDNLFSFIEKVLKEEYINPRKANIDNIVLKYKAELSERCKTEVECSYEANKNIVEKMLNTFNDTHLKYFESNGLNFSVGTFNGSGRFGFYGEHDKSKFVISYVYPNSPAEKADLHVGDIVIEINNKIVNPSDAAITLREKEISFAETIIKIKRSKEIKTITIRGSDSRIYTPVLYSLSPETDLIRIPECKDYQEREFHNIISDISKRNIKSLILDLRDNEGGTSLTSMKMAAAFYEKPGRISTEKDGTKWIFQFDGKGISWKNFDDPSNNGMFPIELNQVSHFKGKVAILVSNNTYSAGEQLAHLLQTNGVARVFGMPTAGALESSATTKQYPGGGILLYSIGLYSDLNGVLLPPRVTPDQIVPLDLEALSQGHDSQIEAAMKWLHK